MTVAIEDSNLLKYKSEDKDVNPDAHLAEIHILSLVNQTPTAHWSARLCLTEFKASRAPVNLELTSLNHDRYSYEP